MPEPRILIVDKANGYEASRAYDGKEALERTESELPQLIIIDLLMDTVNEGYDLCLKGGHNRRFEDIHLLMISATRQKLMTFWISPLTDILFWGVWISC